MSKRALGPRFSPGRPDRTGRAAGRSLAGWTAALRRARPGGRSGTKPRLSLRCSSAASLPRGVRRPPGLPLAVPARRAAAARPRGARGLPRPRGRAALPSPPPGKRPEPGARLRGGQDCGWRRSRLRLPRDGLRQQQAVPLPPVRRSQGNAAGGLLALGCFGGRRCGGGLVSFFFFSFFSPPRCSREGSGRLCVLLRDPHAPCRGQPERLAKFGGRACCIFLKEASDIYLSACLFHRTPVPLSAIAWFVL